MAEGLVTFFRFEHFGFYKRGGEYSEPLSMADFLEMLKEWRDKQNTLADTLPWCNVSDGYDNRKKVYLKSVKKNEDTGDYLITLWKSVGSGDGIYGVYGDAPVDDGVLVDAKESGDGRQIIWGEPAYYWFIPEIDRFASIRFPNSVSDSKLLNSYIRDFIELRAPIDYKSKEVVDGKNGTYTKVSFPSQQNPKDNLWFRIRSKQCIKITDSADLEKIASEITHFVKREVVSTTVQTQGNWERLFNGLPYLSGSDDRVTRKVEVITEAKPTARELKEILIAYHDNYSFRPDNWQNLGFKKSTVGGTCWLNTFVMKNTLKVDDSTYSNRYQGFYSLDVLFAALHLRRDNLIAPLAEAEIYEEEVVA